MGPEGQCDRMLRTALQRRGDGEGLFLRWRGGRPPQQSHAEHGRTTRGERPGLVEQHGVHGGEPLHGIRAHDEYALTRQTRGRRSDRHRRREGQRTRTGRHQHREHGRQCAGRVEVQPGEAHHEGQHQHPQHEPGRHAFGGDAEPRPFALRTLEQAYEAMQGGLVGAPRRAQRERGTGVGRTAEQGFARRASLRFRLAGDQRFIDQGVARGDDAVHRDHLTARHAQHVSGDDGRERYTRDRARRRIDALHLCRQRAGERFGDACGLMPPAHLDMPTDEQEQDEHRDRVEVDLARPAGRVEGARAEREQQRDRHRDVHAEHATPDVMQTAAQDGRSRIEQDRRGEQQTGPSQVVGDLRVDALEGAGP